jgi:hypothetical protein
MGNFHPLSPSLLSFSPSDGRVHCKPTLSQKPSGSPSPCSKSSNTLLIANCCSDWLPHSCRTTPCPPWAPCSIASRPFPKPAGRIEQVFGRVQRADGSYMGCRRVAYGMVRVWGPLVLGNRVQYLRVRGGGVFCCVWGVVVVWCGVGRRIFEHPPLPLRVFENAVFAPLLQVPPTV